MKKPNLLFIFADQWRRDAMGFMKKDEVITPNIDSFAEEALSFDNAMSACPLCSPNRATMFTGKYPISHGVWTNCKNGLNNVFLKEEEITLMDVLKNNGYTTGYIGKWHLDLPESNLVENPKSGARDWDAYTPPGKKRHGVDYWYSYGAYDHHLEPHYWNDSEEMIQVKQWSVEHETDRALEFIDKNKENPFALIVSWNPPHTPLDLVPQKYVDIYAGKKFKVNPNVLLTDVTDHTESVNPRLNFTDDEYQEIMRKYFAAVTGVDENFGRLLQKLKDDGLYDDTIIVLTADHGELLCAHRLWSKHVWYEESVAVPFIIKYGDRYIKGRTESVLNGVDIMPTILSLMGLPIPNTVEGVDLKEVILTGDKKENYAILSAYPGQARAVKGFEEVGEKNIDYGWRAVRSERYTYVINRGYRLDYGVERLLYDNIADPYQLNPVKIDKIEENPLAEKFEKILKEWANKYQDNFKF
ncbi:sulfatase family protein [Fusobacterium mortiferum]|uniref:DUF229 domain-containing protein n=2 Tax=Bacteria TaxID=2 RepID=A0ABM6TW68_FUSMR|nr:sulfatase [Fusobacterium mortiferum]AVQ18422.1 DUF229 domain-containing protein [Fusobacterium mortiferum ATCC 9817]EEO34658.1 arylsulfatase [Fusobacterium mortiferum ATCC 9817]